MNGMPRLQQDGRRTASVRISLLSAPVQALRLHVGSRCLYLQICRIFIKTADCLFSSSWRILEPGSCTRAAHISPPNCLACAAVVREVDQDHGRSCNV